MEYNMINTETIAIFIKVQKELRLKTDSKSKGTGFNYSYLSLPGLIDAVLPTLEKYDLFLTQYLDIHDGVEILCTKIQHTSAEYIEAKTIIPSDWADVKDWGGFVTYKRRYSLMGLLGLQQDDTPDDHTYTQKPLSNTSMYQSVRPAPPRTISAQQAATLEDLLKDIPNAKKAILNQYNISRLVDLPVSAYPILYNKLKK